MPEGNTHLKIRKGGNFLIHPDRASLILSLLLKHIQQASKPEAFVYLFISPLYCVLCIDQDYVCLVAVSLGLLQNTRHRQVPRRMLNNGNLLDIIPSSRKAMLLHCISAIQAS